MTFAYSVPLVTVTAALPTVTYIITKVADSTHVVSAASVDSIIAIPTQAGIFPSAFTSKNDIISLTPDSILSASLVVQQYGPDSSSDASSSSFKP